MNNIVIKHKVCVVLYNSKCTTPPARNIHFRHRKQQSELSNIGVSAVYFNYNILLNLAFIYESFNFSSLQTSSSSLIILLASSNVGKAELSLRCHHFQVLGM